MKRFVTSSDYLVADVYLLVVVDIFIVAVLIHFKGEKFKIYHLLVSEGN